MDKENNVTEELALIDIDAIGEAISTIVEQGTDAVMDFFTSPSVALVWETTTEIGAELA